MNIKRELNRLERKEQFKASIGRAFNLIKNLLCQHKECYSEIISVELGNCSSSILEELIGKESSLDSHKMKIKIIRCANCGRELYRSYLDDKE